jgi:ATP-binding cassette, subfamily B, bacterial
MSAFVAQVLDAVVLAVQLLAVKRILARLSADDQGTFSTYVPALVVMTICYTARAILLAYVREHREMIAERLQADVTLHILEAAGRADVPEFENPAFHDRLIRVRDQTYEHVWTVVWAMVDLTGQALITISMVVLLITISPLTFLVAVAGVLPFLWANRRRNRLDYRVSVEQATRDRERAYIEELLVERRAIPELRSLAADRHLLARVRQFYDLRIADVRRISRSRLRVAMIGGAVGSVLAAVALGVLLAVVVRDGLGIAEAGVAVLALQQVLGQFRGSADMIGEIDRAVPFLDDFQAFRDEYAAVPPDPKVPTDPTDPKYLPPLAELSLSGISFRYPNTDHEVLHGINVTIPAGSAVALVGHNGSGKSTLAKLLAGLYRPTSGELCWNGVSLAEIPLSALRSQVALVFQEFGRYELSAHDNVALGDVSRADDRQGVDQAMDRAGARTFIEQLSAGSATRLSRSYEGGAELSGGQWQRLALARAFFRDAPLLVLDEPASALDPVGERQLFDDLKVLAQGRTVIMISHRFSTVRNADRILVLDEGHLVEDGDHESLMAHGGLYAKLFALQAAPYGG